MNLGHYTTYINRCKKKPFYWSDSKITEFEMINTKKSLCCLRGNEYIDYVMFLIRAEGLEF